MTVRIVLPAGTGDDLSWKKEEAEGKRIIWEMDWKREFSYTDSAFFSSQALALKECGRLFLEQTEGVILYRGKAYPEIEDFDKYQQWLEGKNDTPFYRNLYSTEVLYEYLHRLGSFLPDTFSIIACLDASNTGSPAEQAYLFSLERAGHLKLDITGASIPTQRQEISRGVCLPPIDGVCIETLDLFFLSLEGDYRIIPESVMNEHWDGLEELVVLEKFLTVRGKRMVQGFIAAGGEVVTR